MAIDNTILAIIRAAGFKPGDTDAEAMDKMMNLTARIENNRLFSRVETAEKETNDANQDRK